MVATVRCHGDGSYPPGPSALIVDGNHDGNAFFFWLPPLLKQQAPPGQVLSNQLRPTVTISNLCSGDVLRTFAGSQVEVSDSEFHVNWHTSDDTLDEACTYRITTSVGRKQLGVADVDVMDSGRELKNVNTNEYIALLDDRTLPIKFFIGVGSQCDRAGSDCGEGTARPGENTTIVTASGQAGVFVPAGAVDHEVTISIESSDDRPCIPGLPSPVFPGTPGAVGNACYDYHTNPPLAEVNERGRFNTNVTVGICPDINAMALDHATMDLLQIFQFDAGRDNPIRALNNVPAPFLRCDPNYSPSSGSVGSMLLRSWLRPIAAVLSPRPLFASTRATAFDMGSGGSTDEFSRFQWALPSQVDINFDIAPDLRAIAAGTAINSLYSRVGVTFSRTNPLGLCPGSAVYSNDLGPLGFTLSENSVTMCPAGITSEFSEAAYGAIQATFTVPAAEACISATPLGFRGAVPLPGGVAFIEALDASGSVLSRTESTVERVAQQLCVRGERIAAVRFAGSDAAFAVFDNLHLTRTPPGN